MRPFFYAPNSTTTKKLEAHPCCFLHHLSGFPLIVLDHKNPAQTSTFKQKETTTIHVHHPWPVG